MSNTAWLVVIVDVVLVLLLLAWLAWPLLLDLVLSAFSHMREDEERDSEGGGGS